MAEVTRRRTGEFVQKLFQILIEHPEGMRARDALTELAKAFKLTEYEAGNYEATDANRFEKIVRFATVDCSKAGWMQKQGGVWFITDEGKSAYKQFKDPETLYREAVRLYREWKLGQKAKDQGVATPSAAEMDERAAVSITFEEASDQAQAEIERYLASVNPYDFQQMVADLVKAMGYHVSWIAPPGKDGGIDIVAHTDPLGTRPPRIKIQVKRLADKVTADGLKAFIALVNEDDVGLFISLGGFTRDATSFARNQERRKITLIDQEKFLELWIEHYAKLEDLARQKLPLTPIWFLTPDS